MKIFVKNMVCDRCKLAIRNVLDDMDVAPLSVALGEIDLGERALTDGELDEFKGRIQALGFELMSGKKSQLIERIKNAIIRLVHRGAQPEKVRLSEYLSGRLYHDYGYLSTLFSSVEGITIEQYFINQKIEKAKELLVYDELTLTGIADRLGYSSVAHLSRQFKKVTGQTPSAFKAVRDSRQRKSLDKV